MPNDLSIPRMSRKQIELWDITSTSGNLRPYQIQTANVHFRAYISLTMGRTLIKLGEIVGTLVLLIVFKIQLCYAARV